MRAKGLILACLSLLSLPCIAEEKSPEAKAQRAAMEKRLFPLLQEADEVVLYSLYPLPKANLKEAVNRTELSIAFGLGRDRDATNLSEPEKKVAALARSGEAFQGFPVLGQSRINDRAEVAKALGELRAAMLTEEESHGSALCFLPRHGILVRKAEAADEPAGGVAAHAAGAGQAIEGFDHRGLTQLKGLPDSAKSAGELFKHFNKDFEAYLNTRLDAAGLTRSPYKEHPPKDGK